MTNIIQTRELSRRFGKIYAVDRLNLEVPYGCVYGFLGPNGAGKSTTIRLLLGLLKPNQGQISIFNQSISKDRVSILAKVGAMVEHPAFYPHLTGRENLEIIRRLRGLDDEAIEKALETVKLKDQADKLTKKYSTGMKQRLGLAIAVMGQPKLLILDEPTNGLDPAGIHEIRDLIVRLPEEHEITVFLSSHHLNEVEQVATRIGIIQGGKLIFQGTQEALQSQLQETVVLSVDQVGLASRLLEQAGWQVKRNGNQKLIVSANGSSDAAMINSQLITQGIQVFQVSLERPSLEDIFLTLTSD